MASDIATFVSSEDDKLHHAGDEPVPEAWQGSQPPRWWHGKWPAEGIKSKQDLVPYLRERRNDLCFVLEWRLQMFRKS